MAGEQKVLVHIHVSQGDALAHSDGRTVHAVVSTPQGASEGGASRGAHRTPSAQPGARPSARRGAHQTTREWGVHFHGSRYDVVDRGAAGMTITLDGATVWTGQRTAAGVYATHSTTLPADRVHRLLARVSEADAGTPEVHVEPSQQAPSTPTSAHSQAHPASGVPSKRPLSERQAASLAHGREVRAANIASQRSAGATAPAATPKRERRARSGVEHAGAAQATSPAASPAPAAPASATRVSQRAAPSKRVEAGPPTQRSSKRPEARISDEAVLAELKEKLQRELPDTAEQVYPRMRALWLGGGREATLAWKQTHEIKSIVDAFADWMEHNGDAAKAILEQAEAPKNAKGKGKARGGRSREAA